MICGYQTGTKEIKCCACKTYCKENLVDAMVEKYFGKLEVS